MICHGTFIHLRSLSVIARRRTMKRTRFIGGQIIGRLGKRMCLIRIRKKMLHNIAYCCSIWRGSGFIGLSAKLSTFSGDASGGIQRLSNENNLAMLRNSLL